MIGGAYLLQGIVAALGALMLGILAQLGVPLETQVGVLASGAVPWVLKVVLGLLLDLGPSWPLRVRACVLTGLQLAAAIAMATLARVWLDGEGGLPSSVLLVGLGWVVLNLALATQDALVDALALDLLGNQRSWTAAAMGLGHVVGGGVIVPLLIGGVIGREGMGAGLRATVPWLAGVALLPVALLWARGRPVRARDQPLARASKRPNEWARLLAIPPLFVLVMLTPNLTQALSGEFLFAHLRWDIETASKLLPIGAIAGVLGALAWGPVVQRFGAARATMIASLALGLAYLLFGAAQASWSQVLVVQLLAGAEGFLQPALLVGLHALALWLAARSPLPVTAFVVAMAAINLPRVLGPMLAPTLFEHGFVGVFVACGAIQLVAGLASLAIGNERRFPGVDGTRATL